ncbi:MAG: hypothetical protein C4B55_03610 [Candidatus Methanophagaceae archaeon]|nr:MAG: hypothetical protein C4B55_03610 [Methanophagales archaeon]
MEVCERILEERIKIKWFCDSRVELVDEELLKIMRKSGCIGISYGVESGSQKILQIGIINAKPGTEFTKLAIENKWAEHWDLNWKRYLAVGSGLKNYEPFNLDLNTEIIKIKRLLIYNPRWWMTCINSLIRNRELILPAIRRLFRK